jgi:hypothetical protein
MSEPWNFTAAQQAFEQLIAEDDQACGYQDPEE